MKKILDVISEEVKKAFAEAGYDETLGRVTISNRPDLCEYQCNGAMAGAKQYHKAPIMIANDVAAKLAESKIAENVNAVAPGFLNMDLNKEFLAAYLQKMECLMWYQQGDQAQETHVQEKKELINISIVIALMQKRLLKQ